MRIKKVCPVPYDQQPINEYYSLKNSCFFAWSTLSFYKYLLNILIILFVSFICCLPLTLSIISFKKHFFISCLVNLNLANFLLILIFLRLYLGWSYVVKRLVSASIFYEESGWYDGQIWIKNTDSLTQDRLIGTYEVMPLINRVKYSLSCSLVTFAIQSLTLYYLL